MKFIEGSAISNEIRTNKSVNYSWGGEMCESKDNIYFISDDKVDSSKQVIMSMKRDGTDIKAISKSCEYFVCLTIDGTDLFYLKGSENSRKNDLIRKHVITRVMTTA